MTLAAPELVMIGASAASASCCLAPATRASRWARGVALSMVSLMIAMTLTESAVPLYGGALLLVAFSTGLIVASLKLPDPMVEWHRAVGGLLMAAVTLLHLHTEETVGRSTHPRPTHDAIIETGLQLAVGAYLLWILVTIVRMWRQPPAHLLRWEHFAMGLSVAVMTFAMH